MQTLFEWDFNALNEEMALEALERNANEFAPGMGDLSFTKALLKNVIKKIKTIDSIIEKAAPEWPIEKIAIIDRNVLRIGLFELLFADKNEVPPKVAINEAIELAKTFSGETSGKFVNGVLGAVYRELGEPGKDEGGKRKKRHETDPAKFIVEKLGGAVVYARKDGVLYLALVHDIFGHWTLSKGKLEAEDKDLAQATIREIKEELGVPIVIKEGLGSNEYIASDPERGKIRKQVAYFLAETPYQNLTLGTSGGLDDAEWFTLAQIPDLKMYNDILPIVTRAIKLLNEKYT